MRKLGLLCSVLLTHVSIAAASLPIDKLKLPPGFTISIYAYPVDDAREMAIGPNNTVFVGTRRAGKVMAIVPDKTHEYGTRVITIATGLSKPNGVAFHDGALYVATTDQVLRYSDIMSQLDTPPKPTIILSGLPDKGGHNWRFIAFGPDGKLYLGIGAPCNICLEEDTRFATIMRMNPDGSDFEIYAEGIRNTVGFDWHPQSNELWFTDNGRDYLGDDQPPDELDYAPKVGMHFGFPYCQGGDISDPEFGKQQPCSKFTPPVVKLPAHVAALGMRFYKGTQFPPSYRQQIFIAEHGSWNRSSKIGYQVVTVKLHGKKGAPPVPFITGWLQGETVWGRPVDVLGMPDGSLLISDDTANVVYRVSYQPPSTLKSDRGPTT